MTRLGSRAERPQHVAADLLTGQDQASEVPTPTAPEARGASTQNLTVPTPSLPGEPGLRSSEQVMNSIPAEVPGKRGRGRPRKAEPVAADHVTKGVRLPADIAESLRRYCFEQRTNSSDVIREALTKFLKKKGY